jgi:aspartate oxidase
VATAALDRRESRGAHQREDFEATHKEYERSATISMSGEEVKLNG